MKSAAGFALAIAKHDEEIVKATPEVCGELLLLDRGFLNGGGSLFLFFL